MEKNILVLTGSPRKNGNSDLLAEAFIKGAGSRSHQIHKFEAGLKKITPCVGCEQCWSSGKPCVVRDDFDELSSLFERADVIVFSSPLYWFGISTQLKIAWDKFHSYIRPGRRDKLTNKETACMICGRNPDPAMYKLAVETYLIIGGKFGWNNRGVIVVPGVFEKQAILGNAALLEAEKLGLSI
jgi:multimeric flavodoxin WrbA